MIESRMSEIRDAEAEKYFYRFHGDDEPYEGWESDDFKSGWDARDKLDNEALKLAVEGLELMNKGPAKTMAEPWSVWYSEHSGKCLAKIRKLKGEV